MDGGQVNVNGRSEGSPELFDLSRLGDSLAEPMPRTCRTPEAFLGPAAASLVNLDSLIPPNQGSKNLNPFLTGEHKWDVSPHSVHVLFMLFWFHIAWLYHHIYSCMETLMLFVFLTPFRSECSFCLKSVPKWAATPHAQSDASQCYVPCAQLAAIQLRSARG